jgi:hypothetical protein
METRADGVPERPLKTALFVDFDNIFIGLNRLDNKAAKRFATDPTTWLAWLGSGMPTMADYGEIELPERHVLVRRCYLNPAVMGNRDYRVHFIRSGFSVVDCPSVTEQGKNNADILMVMDILDALEHHTRFDEFIIFSGDSDFTPVLLRLRAYDRRTAVVTAGLAAEAYKAAADRAVPPELFIEFGLGLASPPLPIVTPPVAVKGRNDVRKVGPSDELLDRIATVIAESVRRAGQLGAAELPTLLHEIPELRNSSWLGLGSLRRLIDEVVRRHRDLKIMDTDPWSVCVGAAAASPVPIYSDYSDYSGSIGSQPSSVATTPYSPELVRSQVFAIVREIVDQASEPVSMATAAAKVRSRLGGALASDWAGCGSFKGLLSKFRPLPFEVVTGPGGPGMLVDRARHRVPTVADPEPRWVEQASPDLADLVRRVHQIAQIPLLSPDEFVLLFRVVSEVVKEQGYNIIQTPKMVSERCVEKGYSIPGTAVAFVLKGIIYGGHKLGEGPDSSSPAILANAFKQNLIEVCKAAQLDISGSESLLAKWLPGHTA